MYDFSSDLDMLKHFRAERVQFLRSENAGSGRMKPEVVDPKWPLKLDFLSEWMPDPDTPDGSYSWMRIKRNGDPTKIEDRRCFIEKTPRIYDPTFGLSADDWRSWPQGYKGSAPEYGMYQPSREWCDRMAITMGYRLPPEIGQIWQCRRTKTLWQLDTLDMYCHFWPAEYEDLRGVPPLTIRKVSIHGVGKSFKLIAPCLDRGGQT